MRVNRWIMLVSLAVGLAGVWFVYDAASTYVAATRAYASVDVRYESDSFIWLDPAFERGRADITIHNESDSNVTVALLDLHLYFDDEFAGSRYTPWQPLEIPSGTSAVVTTEFQIAISRIRPQGGTADLSLRGSITLEFDDVSEPLTFPLRGTIGQVAEIGR
ncbi:MAG: hypothetical protein H0V47_04705 [Chloroflexia bacterium]|nr:hypothetical protein [Chloroflexia bacterium]